MLPTNNSEVAKAAEGIQEYHGIGISETKIYSKTSTSANVLKSYEQGSLLKYVSFSNDWYQAKVYLNGKATIGYIHANDVENIKAPQKELTGLSLHTSTKIYSNASTTSSVLKSYEAGTILKYKTLVSGWYEAKVYINGKAVKGFIKASDIETIPAQEDLNGVGVQSPINIYSKAATNSAVLKSYDLGTILKYKTLINGWYEAKVYIKGKATTGFIRSADVENIPASQKELKGIGLQSPTNIYSKAATNSSVLKSYDLGTILKYQTLIPGWYEAKVYIKGKEYTGFIKDSDTENITSPQKDLTGYGAKNPTPIYSKAATNSSVLKSYPQGTKLQFRSFTSKWYEAKVYINGQPKTGYILKDDIGDNPFLNVDLRKTSNVTANDIVDFFNRNKPNSPLKDYAQNFINVQNKYGVNAAYLVAHAIWETGWGGSNLQSYKNNLFGYGAYDECPFTCGYYYPTVEDSINSVAYMIRTDYLNPDSRYYYAEHGSTLTGMNQKYATDNNWKNGIANLMALIKPYNVNHYSSADVLSVTSNKPGNYGRELPAGEDYPASVIINFPEETTGEITDNVNVRSLPYPSSSTLLGSLNKSSKVTVLGYNTYLNIQLLIVGDATWYRISFDGKTAWVYGGDLTIENLLEVFDVSNTLNIRKVPIDGEVVGKVTSNDFLKPVLSEEKPVINEDGWYQVYLPNSKETGWVSGEFIRPVKH